MKIEIHDRKDDLLGSFTSDVVPRAGEILWLQGMNTGLRCFEVVDVCYWVPDQHDGYLSPVGSACLYVKRCRRRS